ncbi:hypothetical protein FM076_11560, partial [Streptomyces albus subsp. chlorinus]|uniref:AfsR/SARP family transcriptional regulator n=1 Tax=Streptomyces albus TaxID=1888 RepID=UPI00191D60E5
DPAARARDALLAGADPDAVRFLDHALRGLAQDLRAAGRPLPVVYAAWLTGQDLHLQLAEETEEPPAPWRYGQNRSFWTVQRADLRGEVDTEAAPPYPGLVCLGLRGEARLLLNLESVPGLVSVAGDPELRDAVLASVAAELATGSWSQVTGITLVGFGAELTVLAPGRMRHLPDVATLLREREAAGRGIAGREAVGRAGADTEGAGAWRSAPSQVVLVGAEPTGEEARRLAALAEGDGPAVGFVVGVSEGRLPMPSVVWEFRIEEDGTLAADRMGLAVRAQLLPAPLRAAVVELFADTDDVHTEGSRGPGFRVDLSAGGRPAVYARLMGRYEVVGVEPPEESRSAALHEALALLLLNRDGVHPRVLASALWPKGVGDDVRDALVARLRDWLGTDPDGTHRLTTGEDGRLALRPSVVSDWDVLRTLHHGCTGERGAKLAARLRRRQLADALELARGPLLADRPEGRYGWLAHDVAEAQHPLLVAEVGLALAAEHLRAQDPAAAVGAVRAALRSAPADERLWDELVRAAHATGDADTLDEAVRAVVRYAAELHGPARGVPPRTRALLDELAPHWARLAGA